MEYDQSRKDHREIPLISLTKGNDDLRRYQRTGKPDAWDDAFLVEKNKKPSSKKVLSDLPDENSGDCGDDFTPLDGTDAGDSCFRAYLVAKKTWQIVQACEDVRRTEDDHRLPHLLLMTDKATQQMSSMKWRLTR